MKTLEEIKKVVTCSICGKKVYTLDANKHMHSKEMGWDIESKSIKEQLKVFIQDQQEHEVEDESILEKIPSLVEYLLESTISQTKQELIEESNLELKHKIGMLRQWLNERTSRDLITNEDLEVWLLEKLFSK